VDAISSNWNRNSIYSILLKKWIDENTNVDDYDFLSFADGMSELRIALNDKNELITVFRLAEVVLPPPLLSLFYN